MKGTLHQSKEHEYMFFVEYVGQWKQSTIDLMIANGDNPNDFQCVKEISLHPDDIDLLLDYPNMIDKLVDSEVEFDFMPDGEEVCASLKLY